MLQTPIWPTTLRWLLLWLLLALSDAALHLKLCRGQRCKLQEAAGFHDELAHDRKHLQHFSGPWLSSWHCGVLAERRVMAAAAAAVTGAHGAATTYLLEKAAEELVAQRKEVPDGAHRLVRYLVDRILHGVQRDVTLHRSMEPSVRVV